jgi:hypothetical protein
MWNAVDHLDFTEQQQDIISIGCDVFKRLITSVMQVRGVVNVRVCVWGGCFVRARCDVSVSTQV